jgi:hypothetical protein
LKLTQPMSAATIQQIEFELEKAEHGMALPSDAERVARPNKKSPAGAGLEVGGPRLAIAGLGIKRGTPFYNATRSWQARWPDHAAALRQKLALGDDELADWRDAIARIVTGLDPATGIYEQFAGFHALEPLDLAAYAERTVPIDVVIGRERTQRSQVVKQADVVALMALLPEEFPGATAERNFRRYEPRCAHGSSLSTGMHAVVAARLGAAEMALRYLRETAANRPRPRPQQRRRRAHRFGLFSSHFSLCLRRRSWSRLSSLRSPPFDRQ